MIVPDIAEYEEGDSYLAIKTISDLHTEIDKLKNKLEQQNIDMGLYSDSDIEIKKRLIDRINRQQERIDKAIEQINKDREKCDYGKDGLMKQAFYCNKTNKLLEILKESDKE